MIESSHKNIKSIVQYDGSCLAPFPFNSGVKQESVLAPTLFGIFSLLLSHAFKDITKNMVYLDVHALKE